MRWLEENQATAIFLSGIERCAMLHHALSAEMQNLRILHVHGLPLESTRGYFDRKQRTWPFPTRIVSEYDL
jgi:hypothetical protein